MSKVVFATYIEDVQRVQEFYDTFSFSLDKVPSDGGWTASQCLAHICDSEIALSMRMRMLLTTDNYQFASFDEDAFVAIMPNRDARASVETFAALRRNNLNLLEGLNDSQLSKVGIKGNGEPTALIDYVAYMSKHVRAHLEQAVAAAK
jgi:hypothetical protein